MPVPRPLPPQPSLEFEHKAAKALLRRLRAGDPEALARARARHPATPDPARARLADAQLVIAREYGFASWPKLVHYFRAVERQRHVHGQTLWPGRESYEREVARWLAAHRNRRVLVGRSLAAYVPRFYGMSVEEVYASAVTEDDVRLAIARQNGVASWELLLERADASAARHRTLGGWDASPGQLATRAIEAGDLDALRAIAAAHPELLHPSADDEALGGSLLRTALHHERRRGREALRPIVEWLEAQGLDVQRELNRQLCGHMRMRAEKVRWLLDRGADPDWVAPNGIPVLEHALIRYWSGEAVDVLAARATPRTALWIAAGLGDVDGVRRSLDRDGKPTAAARRLRPDFDAVAPRTIPSLLDPDDEELLVEAFFVAMLNGRTAVLEYMASRGAPLDSLIYGSPLINIAVGNAWTPVVETLVRCGADLDLRGYHPTRSAREIAREMLEQMPNDAERRRVAELCGLDPDAVLAERDARPARPPDVHPGLHEALALAGDDAFRLGQRDVRPENLLVGLLSLRDGGMPGTLVAASRLDLDRFRADLRDRVRPGESRQERPALPLDPDAQATVQAMTALATERRRDLVTVYHLLHALVRDDGEPVAELLARYGASAARLREELERAL